MRQEKTQGRRPQKATQPQPWELPPQPITRTLNHPPLLGLGTAPSSVLCSHTLFMQQFSSSARAKLCNRRVHTHLHTPVPAQDPPQEPRDSVVDHCLKTC